MQKQLLFTTIFILLGVGWPFNAESAEVTNAPVTQVVKEFSFKQTKSAELKYLLYIPKGYETNIEQHWPLILFLHGAGQRGDEIWHVAGFGLPQTLQTNQNFPFIVVSPQCPWGSVWSDTDMLMQLLDKIESNYRVDSSRIYVTGLSMGGYGTWDLGLNHPERFAAIAPVCGGSETIVPLLSSAEPKVAPALKSLSIWAFHGAKDPVVTVDESERMVSFLKKLGVEEVKLTVYPNAEHDAWTETYSNPELYEWLLKHHRKEAKGVQ